MAARERFNPLKIGRKVEVVFIAESPPVTGAYFYFLEKPPGSLFRETMKALQIDGNDKREKLIKFQWRGFFMLDVTYKPINNLKGKARMSAVKSELPRLVEDVRELQPNGIVIIKKPLFEPVKTALAAAGLGDRILHDAPIPFPGSGRQKEFREAIVRLMY
jgi:hypothetical protein